MSFILLLFLTSKEASFVLLQFLGARRQGCFYRFSQAVWEAVQNHGLQLEYTSNNEPKILYQPTDGSGVLTRVGDLDILLSYFENTWLDGGQFSPAKRSVLNWAGLKQTKQHCCAAIKIEKLNLGRWKGKASTGTFHLPRWKCK